MKIAYLIIAHNNYKHLRRFIDALDSENSEFFVHIDKRSPLPSLPQKVHFVKREKVYWAGFSLVQASLNLLEAAKKTSEAAYFVLLSGQDYPIAANSQISATLQKNKAEYINILRAPHPSKPMKRFNRYYFDGIDRRKKSLVNYVFLFPEKVLKLFLRKNPPFKLFVGSQWFALSGECVEYILQVLKEDPRYVKFFKHVFCPDEAFFQTIIGNSSFYDKCRHNLTYTDWSSIPAPAFIEEHHLDELKSTKICHDIYGDFQPLFVRKLKDDSEDIVNRIDREFRQ